MAPLDPFEVGPYPLTGIPLRRRGREPLQRDAVRGAVPQQRRDYVTTVARRPSPHDDDATGHLPQPMLQKGDHVLRIDRTVLTGELPLALGRDGPDRGEMVTGPPLPPDGRVPHRGIGADDTGHRREPGCTYQLDGVRLGLRPLLRAPANGLAPAAHMDGVGGDATFPANHRGDPATSPDLSPKAIGFGPPVQEHGQPRQLVGGQPAGSPGAWTLPEGLQAPFAGRCLQGLTAPALTPRAAALSHRHPPCGMRCQP